MGVVIKETMKNGLSGTMAFEVKQFFGPHTPSNPRKDVPLPGLKREISPSGARGSVGKPLA